MKKIALIMAALSVAATLLAGCGGGSFHCEMCEEEKTGNKHVVDMFGEKITMCDECKGYFDAGMDAIGDIDLGDLDFDF